jgi:hypothetical protein
MRIVHCHQRGTNMISTRSNCRSRTNLGIASLADRTVPRQTWPASALDDVVSDSNHVDKRRLLRATTRGLMNVTATTAELVTVITDHVSTPCWTGGPYWCRSQDIRLAAILCSLYCCFVRICKLFGCCCRRFFLLLLPLACIMMISYDFM